MFERLVEATVDALVSQAKRVSCEQAKLLGLIKEVVQSAPETEFGVDEVAFALSWTRKAADMQVALAYQLIDHMPEVFKALGTGVIDLPKAKVFADVLRSLEPDVASEVAAQVLPVAGEKTTAQLRERLHRRALAADPDFARRRRALATAERRVVLEPMSDGTATLTAIGLPAERAAAAFERVKAIAKARKVAGETTSMHQLCADTVLDLLEGVGVGAVPGARRGVVEINVDLETLAGLDENAGQLAGYGPVAADIARQCAVSNLDSQWQYRVHHPKSGELLFQGITRARPPKQDPDARFPNAAMSRWIRSRDRTCRAPGCRAPAVACDIDHTVDYARGGRTTHDKLCLLCRHHHRLKHEGGWKVLQSEPGVITWISPSGRIYRVGPEPP